MMKTKSKQTETQLRQDYVGQVGEIPEDWEIQKLKNVAYVEMGQSPKSVYYNSDGEGLPFLQGIRTFGDKYPTFDTWCTQPTKIAEKGDVLLSVRAPVGVVNIATKRLCIGRGVTAIRSKNNAFLYYLLNANVGRIESRGTGTVYKSINKSDIQNLLFGIPPIDEQKKIAFILSSLDDKIELNRKMNQTLEEMGKALFKHWFVGFEFPNNEGRPYKSNGGKMVDSEFGEIPKGWEVESLDEIAIFLNGLACQKYPPTDKTDSLPVIKIAELRRGFTESSDKASSKVEEKYHVSNGDVLFSWSGSLEVCLWPCGTGILNQHLFKVTSENFPKWFYYLWILEYLSEFRTIASGKATTMGHIQRKHLTNAKVLVPDESSFDLMSLVMTPVIEKIVTNNQEINSLQSTRDSLLPRLMSGRLRVT